MNTLQNLLDKLNEAMAAIQNLQIQPTEHNCGNIMKALGNMREIANIGMKMAQKIGEMEHAARNGQTRENGSESEDPENVIRLEPEKEYKPSEDALDGNAPCVQEGDI